MNLPRTAEVIVAGGGVIGCSIAYFLTLRGLRPLVLERSSMAAEASGANAAFVWLHTRTWGADLALAMRSYHLYRRLDEELPMDIEFRKDRGGMILCREPEHLDFLRGFVIRQRRLGLPMELLDGGEARRREPSLSPDTIAASFCPLDSQVNPLRLTLALARGAKALGARFETGVSVSGVRIVKGQVAGVDTTLGFVSSPVVVNAGGAWAGRLTKLPIRPMRIAMVVTEPVAPLVTGDIECTRKIAHNASLARECLEHLGRAGDSSEASRSGPAGEGIMFITRQMGSGNLLVGEAWRYSGFDKRPSLEDLRAICRHAVRVMPSLRGLGVIRTFVGLAPYTPDGLPILGQYPGVSGLFCAAGHCGSGVLWAPVTGEVISEAISGDEPSVPLDELGPGRFTKTTLHRDYLTGG